MTRFIAFLKRGGDQIAHGGTLQQARDRVTLNAPAGIEILDFGDDERGSIAWNHGLPLRRARLLPFAVVAFDGAALGLPETVTGRPPVTPPPPVTPAPVPYVRGRLPFPPPRRPGAGHAAT